MKIKPLFFIVSASMSVSALAQPQVEADTVSLTVVVNGASSDQGVVRVALYNDADNYLEKELAALTAPAKKQGVSVTFTNLTRGTYALAALHDENNNGKMERVLGIPTEAYGFSKVRPKFRPARFKEASFEIDQDQNTQTVNIK